MDFLIDDVATLSAMPLVIRSGKDYTVHSALNCFVGNEYYNIPRGCVLSNNR